MLVLSRKVDEAIRIGEDVRIVILDIDSDRIRIGIDAPRSQRIYREELLLQTVDVNKEALQATKATVDFSKMVAQAATAAKPAEEGKAPAEAKVAEGDKAVEGDKAPAGEKADGGAQAPKEGK